MNYPKNLPPEMWEKLNKHDFDGDTENIDFIFTMTI